LHDFYGKCKNYNKIFNYSMSNITVKNKNLIYPALTWFGIFFMLPLLIIFVYSFTTDYMFSAGGVKFTLDNFLLIFQKKHYLIILGRSLKISLITTVLSIAFAYPVAYFLAKKPVLTGFL